ncbi:DUF1801 domain-containing protein [uncultured Ruegeria sp.]|uniref:DUF1801 domain-containing protein n=1 Tax=uncultured Ruegeria sp. TaxID=259304 RepID=UPI00261F62B6|nr:DUF1801 domain-containing protein [uncultured Ruegeria sp.]
MDELEEVERALINLCRDLRKDLSDRQMYGGTMFEAISGVHSTRTFGVFRHKDHVTLEFSNGASLADPDTQLDGGGKYRRNLKFRQFSDITSQNTEDFVRSAESATSH